MRIDRHLASPDTPPPTGLDAAPWLALGFRPFFLVAGLMGALWLPLWIGAYRYGLPLPLAVTGAEWHWHELIFGLAAAVLAGFLLTASRNWTKIQTPHGALLFALLLVWISGRIVMLLGGLLPPILVAVIDVAFLPLTAFALGSVLVRAKNKRNYAFSLMLFGLGVFNALFHAGGPGLRRAMMTSSVDLLALFLVFMGGRVIPFFTKNALKSDARVKTPPALAWTATVLTALTIASPALPEAVAGILLIAAGVANLARLALWGPLTTRKNSLLWILHLGYAWIGFAQLLRGLAPFVPVFHTANPIHALTVGALSGLILGMMIRVSLGHTGRPLVTPRPMTFAFVLLMLSAFIRSILPLFVPSLTQFSIVTSGALYGLAFLIFVVIAWPILTRPRADGAPG